MPHRIDPESFGFLVTDVARMLRAEMDRRIADAGLGVTAGEARALAHIARAGAVRQSALAERIGIEAMTLSAYVDRLEEAGLVRREVDPCDRRARIVHLTDAAEDRLAAIEPIGGAVRDQASQGIAANDWERLLDLLKSVRANLADARTVAQRRERPAA